MNTTCVITFFLLISLSFEINRIKQCQFSSKCINVNEDVSIEIHFNISPKKLGNGELINNSNSTIKYTSLPSITKNKVGVVYKFTPSIPGKYHFKFNHNLNCNDVLTVKDPLKAISMPHTLFLTDDYKGKKITFPISIKLNTSITENEINGLEVVEYQKKVTDPENYTEPKHEKIEQCKVDLNNSIINCNVTRDNKEEINYLAINYLDRCEVSKSLGYITFISTEYEGSDLTLSVLSPLLGYNLKVYDKEGITLVSIIISKEKRKHFKYLQKKIANVANKYPQYTFTYADWEDDKYFIKHYGLENDGKIKIIIYDFMTENTYISDLEGKDFSEIMESLVNRTIEWTYQSWFQKLLSLFKLNLNKTEQNRLYFVISTMGFVLLVILRCYLYSKKVKKENANFAVNDKKKKD